MGSFLADDQKFGYGHIVSAVEAGKTCYIDGSKYSIGPVTCWKRAGELKTVGESILVSTIDGVFDLFRRQQLWLSGCMNNDLNHS